VLKRLVTWVPVSLVFLAGFGGCTPDGREEFDRPDGRKEFDLEVTRFVYTEHIGPFHAATVVGAAASSGLSGLSAIVADYGLRAAFAQHAKGELPPSPWEVPDPNRPVQIGPSQRVR
jgi:hypothetical protein